jgi:hypothetical protein
MENPKIQKKSINPKIQIETKIQELQNPIIFKLEKLKKNIFWICNRNFGFFWVWILDFLDLWIFLDFGFPQFSKTH